MPATKKADKTSETTEVVEPIAPTIIGIMVGHDSIIVGTGATEVIGEDLFPYTVVDILAPTKVVVQADNFKRVEGSEGEYEYSHNPDGRSYTLTLYPDGTWKARGQGGGTFQVGKRQAYRSAK